MANLNDCAAKHARLDLQVGEHNTMSRFSANLHKLALGGISCFTLTIVASPANAGWGWGKRWSSWRVPTSMQCKMWGGSCTKKSPKRDKCYRDRHCRDHDASTKDWCFEGTCQHTPRDQDSCRAEGSGWCYRDHHCADRDSNTVDWCYNMRCHHAPRDTGTCEDDETPNSERCCTQDRDCKDGDKSTLDWCNEGRCEHKERDDKECKEPESKYCCRDFQCDDGDANTVDWCHDSACHHAPKNGNSCEPPTSCDPEACPQSDNPCEFAICIEDSCGFQNRPEGTRCDENEDNVCNSVGECVPEEDDEPACETAEDCLDDNSCNGEERCLQGTCRPGTPADIGTPCGDQPGSICNGAAECVEG